MITSEQKELVRTSFEVVAPQANSLVGSFYTRLFELDPSLRGLFKVALPEQERKLVDMLVAVVYDLDFPDQLLPVLQSLGVRHRDYGVVDADYNKVGAALLWALEQHLDEQFTPPVREAWEAIYTFISEVMLGDKP